MNAIQNLAPAFLVALILTGCASPQAVSRLQPVSEKTYWNSGLEMVPLSSQYGVSAGIAFVRSEHRYLVFEFTVQNRSGGDLLVTPEVFELYPMDAYQIPLEEDPIYAVNPETVLLDLDKQESRKIAEDINNSTMALTQAALNLAEDISDAGEPKTTEEKQLQEQERANQREYYEVEEYEIETALMSIQEERAYWANSAFRRTTLPDGYELTGLVFFPRYDKATLLKFVFPVDDFNFSALYRQILFPASR